jgi:hypothetical protein
MDTMPFDTSGDTPHLSEDPTAPAIQVGMTADTDHPLGWIEYVIASDEPADKILAREYLASGWESGQITQAILRAAKDGSLTEALFDNLAKMEARSRLLVKRVHLRGAELRSSGAPPADRAYAKWWLSRFHALGASICDEDDQQRIAS